MSSELRALWAHAGGQVPDAWEVVPLEVLLRDSKSIAVGVMYPGPDTPGGIPLLKVGDIKDGMVAQSPTYCISTETNYEHRRTQLEGNELLITLVGTPGECVVVQPHMAGWNPARAIAVLRLQDPSLRTYLKTVLESSAGKHLIDAVLNTTVQKTLNLKDIRRLPIPLPTSDTIDSITQVAEAFSTRITLLRETNTTLEAIAQALFKSWFVDFDPVRAKMEGLPLEGLDEATAALFPDSFEEKALGVVPRGWCIGTLADLMELHKGSVNPGLQPDTEFQHFSLPAFDNEHSPVFELGSTIKSNKTTVPTNGVLLSKLNPHIPRIWLPSTVGAKAVCSTEFLPFVPTKNTSTSFVYCLLAAPSFSAALCQLVTGTSNSHQRIKPDGVLSMPSVLPPTELIAAFDTVASEMLNRLKANRQKSQTLSSLRDTLLPRLISGRLRLPEVTAELEPA